MPGRILVVDDEKAILVALRGLFTKEGYEVDTASSGEEAVKKIEGGRFHVIVTDLSMDGISGMQVLERGRATDPDLAVVMITAHGSEKAAVQAMKLGATDYLPKPFNAVVLKARVTATLEKKRLEDAERHHARELERELEIGRQIQKDFLPEALPRPEGWEIAAAFHPARQVGGDFYDAFDLEDGRVAIAVGDVCDKGVGAALFMALFRSLIRSHAELHGSGTPAVPAARSIVALTNDYIARTHGRSNMFATIFFAILDPRTGDLAWVNGGHEPPILRRAGGAVERLMPTGPAVGAMPDMEFEARTARLAPGDVLVAITDGVTEARSAAGKLYGENGVLGILEAAPARTAALLERIVAAVRAHEAGTEPVDDLTMLAVRRS